MELGQIFTNKYIANFMVSLFTLKKEAEILDPCFGAGAFLRALKNAEFNNLTGYEIDSTIFNKTHDEFEDLNLFNSDFLTAKNTKYDGIIMNPPYVRQEKIDSLLPLGITKKALIQNPLYKGLPSNANLYMYFIVKAISLLKKGGELVVIFPNIWMKAKSGKFLRSLIYEECTVTHQINITGKVFEKKALVDVVILKIIKSNLKDSTTIVKNLYFNGTGLEDKPIIEEYDLGLPVQFSKIATAQRGLSTGYNKLFINPPKGIPTIPILTSPKNIVGYTTDEAKTEQLLYISEPLSKTTKYYLEKQKKEILLNKKPVALYQKILNNENWYTLPLISSRGLIFSYFIRNDIRFIKNDTNSIVRDNFYIITPKINSNLLFALLNNYYTFYQLELLGKKYGAGLLKIQRYDLEKIMFPNHLLFSQDDLILLDNLSNQLMLTGNKEIVLEITRVISKYTLADVDFITTQYSLLKKQRLEDKI